MELITNRNIVYPFILGSVMNRGNVPPSAFIESVDDDFLNKGVFSFIF
jgi:hypothetical protein